MKFDEAIFLRKKSFTSSVFQAEIALRRENFHQEGCHAEIGSLYPHTKASRALSPAE
jgi:hypothetical protein